MMGVFQWCPSFRGWAGVGSVRTFKLATRSAVSSRVNWLIWSTMAEILGLAAASVELYLRVMRWCWRRELEARIGAARSWRAQHCAAYRHDSDMAGDWAFGEEAGSGGYRPVGASGGRIGLAMGCCCCRESRRFFRPSFEKSTGARLIGWAGRPAGDGCSS